MISNMKSKFDKYWDECNLLMAISAFLDPRWKMGGVGFIYHRMFSFDNASDHVLQVKNVVKELFNEYVCEHCTAMDEHADGEIPSGSGIRNSNFDDEFVYQEVFNHVKSISIVQS